MESEKALIFLILWLGPMFIPLIGVAYMIIAASTWTGIRRIFILSLGPAIIVGSSFLWMSYASRLAQIGEGAFLWIISLGLQWIGLLVYYPVLIIVIIRSWLKSRR